MATAKYRRLTWARPRRTGFFSAFAPRSSLWLGADHLLSIDTSGYTENYKRFYFRDIQAITIVTTNRRAVLNYLFGVPLALCLAGALVGLDSFKSEPEMLIVFGIWCVILLIPLLVNNIRGPSCHCYLRTAVQTEWLPPLCRVRRARKVIERIRPLIAMAQGEMPMEEISARMRQLTGEPVLQGIPQDQIVPQPPPASGA